MERIIEGNDSQERSIQDEASTVQVVQQAPPATSTSSTSVNSPSAMDPSRNSQQQTEHAANNDSNPQIEAVHMKTPYLAPSPSLAPPPPAQTFHSEKGEPEAKANLMPEEQMKKRPRCDPDNEVIHPDPLVTRAVSIDDESSELLQDDEVSKGNTSNTNASNSTNKYKVKKRKVLTFEQHFAELTEFKNTFGHWDVPQRFPDNPTLGGWCHNLRNAYSQLQRGQSTCMNLSAYRIDRLEKIGFKWKDTSRDLMFDKRFDELAAFHNKFGHCDVPKRYVGNSALGGWCCRLRQAYNKQRTGKKPGMNISAARIDRLEKIGFKWKDPSRNAMFEMRFAELAQFKNKYRHFNVPRLYGENAALGSWCHNLRTAYSQQNRGQKTCVNLSEERIGRLNSIGFMWTETVGNVTFDKRFVELTEFYLKFGHCNVPNSMYGENSALGYWCSEMRCGYNQFKIGNKPRVNMSDDQIERLETLGFKWKV